MHPGSPLILVASLPGSQPAPMAATNESPKTERRGAAGVDPMLAKMRLTILKECISLRINLSPITSKQSIERWTCPQASSPCHHDRLRAPYEIFSLTSRAAPARPGLCAGSRRSAIAQPCRTLQMRCLRICGAFSWTHPTVLQGSQVVVVRLVARWSQSGSYSSLRGGRGGNVAGSKTSSGNGTTIGLCSGSARNATQVSTASLYCRNETAPPLPWS